MPKADPKVVTNITKLPIVKCREEYKKIADAYTRIKDNSFYCHECGQFKLKSTFYRSIKTASGVIPTCKECLYKIGTGFNERSKLTHETKETVIRACKKADLPFIAHLYESSCEKASNETANERPGSGFLQMIVALQSLPQYRGLGFEDSDFSGVETNDWEDVRMAKYLGIKEVKVETKEDEIRSSYTQNRKDVVNLLGYDPFEKEKETEKPLLYSSFIGYIDQEGDSNRDELRIASIIEIVKSFNQITKLNDTISMLVSDTDNIAKYITTIKNLEDTKSKITDSVLKLAKDSGISLKHSVTASKGDDTWTGKMKQLKGLKLRSGEVNKYNAEYSAGIRQVAELSNAAILKQIRLDENDSSDMIAQQRAIINKYKAIADQAIEEARVLLRENEDLKSLIKERLGESLLKEGLATPEIRDE